MQVVEMLMSQLTEQLKSYGICFILHYEQNMFVYIFVYSFIYLLFWYILSFQAFSSHPFNKCTVFFLDKFQSLNFCLFFQFMDQNS